MDDLSSGPVEPKPAIEGTGIYRGWMLDTEQYSNLVASIEEGGGSPFTSQDQYLLTHHLPNWVPLIQELTPETVVLPNGSDFETELRSLGWTEFFVKDYVKSLKTSMGSRISEPSEIGPLVAEMTKFRGSIEGGLCIRRVEALLAETERRYFVVQGTAFAPDDHPVPSEVLQCAERIQSRFFSVDAALDQDGKVRIVEVGDGQVSDTVGWEIDRFTSLFERLS